jgi:hypothetical protein
MAILSSLRERLLQAEQASCQPDAARVFSELRASGPCAQLTMCVSWLPAAVHA